MRRALIFAMAILGLSPLPSIAQQTPTPVIGFLNSAIQGTQPAAYQAFFRGLRETGFVEGVNVSVEYRWANNDYDRLAVLARELVERNVTVIVAAGGPVSAQKAKDATKNNQIPVVFTTISDPVEHGFVASLNRPGGNLTGNAGLTSELDAKRLEKLLAIKPNARLIGVLFNPQRTDVWRQNKDLEAAAKNIGLKLLFRPALTDDEIDDAFATFAQKSIDGLLPVADPLLNSKRAKIVALAARYAIPAIYQWREFVQAGGLMSYGPSITNAYFNTGIYVGRILKGANPADLPVMRPTKFELVINAKTANSLGLSLSPDLLAVTDDLIK